MAAPVLSCLLLISCSVLTKSQELRVIWNSTAISQDPGIPDPRVLIYHDEINIRTSSVGGIAESDGVLICRHSGNPGDVQWLRPGSSTPVLSSNDGSFRTFREFFISGPTRSQLARVVQTPAMAGNEGLWSCNGGGLSRRYVSLYRRGNGAISDVAVSLQSSSFRSNTFTLAADTTGGPPTTFSWTRNNASHFTASVSIVADPRNRQGDRDNCLYRSALEVTGVFPGIYEYRASNRATSGDVTGSFTIEGGAPSNLQVVQIGMNTVQLTWDPPPGPPSQGYRVAYSGISTMTGTNTSLLTLSPGEYSFVVTSLSQHFPEGTVGPETIAIRGTPLYTPVITLSELTATSVRVSWSSPPMLSFSVTRYDVSVMRLTGCNSITERRGPRRQNADDRTELFEEIEEYINYRAEVTAIFQSPSSSFTVSPVTAEMEFTTPGVVPSANPSNVKVPTVTSRTVNVSLNAIDCRHHNGPNFHYEVELQRMDRGTSRVVTIINGAVGSTVNDELFVVVEDLQPFTDYTLRVRAVNDVGNGDYTGAMMIQTNEDTPGSVIDLNREFISFFSVNITWNPPQEPNGLITAYELTYILNGTTSRSQNITDHFDFTISSDLGTEIEVRVRAYTSVGPGPNATIMFTLSPPTVMSVQVESLTDTSVRVTWDEITISGITISEYVVYYAPISSHGEKQDNEQSVRVSGDENSVEISGLESSGVYRFQVTAVAVLGGIGLEGGRSPVTLFNIKVPGAGEACGDCDATVAVSVSVIVTFLLTIILYSALLLVGYYIVCARRSKPSKKINNDPGMAMKENAAYGPVTSTQQPHDYIYTQPDESQYDIVN